MPSSDLSKRRGQMRRRIGWAAGEHERAEAERATACACCGSSLPWNKHGWFADHDHVTGRFRNKVCYLCNTAIAWVEDKGYPPSPQIFAYLQRHALAAGFRG